MGKKKKQNQNQDKNLNKGTNDSEEDQEWLFDYDRYFIDWLTLSKGSLIVCSYKKNSVFCIGHTMNKNTKQNILSFWISRFNRPMVSHYNTSTKQLYLGTQVELLQFHNDGTSDTDFDYLNDFDCTFTQRRSNIINDLDIHDIVADKDGKIYFCSALFCCVCEISDKASFKVYWKPPWISKIASEDRCHLNGLCCVDGVPRYITAVSRTDTRSAWYENRVNKGVIYDIVENKLICKNLTMPHSPKYHNGKLYVLESGTGYFGFVDFSTTVEEDGEIYHPFVREIFIPGFIRGMTIVNKNQCVIGSSLDRHEGVFQNLPLGKNIEEKSVTQKCGLFVIDLTNMNVIHHFIFKSNVVEIYDISFIPNTNRPVIYPANGNDHIYTSFCIE